ncbi:MAG: killer suppression protein [Gemmatimonadetes bacterium]|nr:killer suppression protein [Gemmatimonadota bacterium]
MDIVFRSQKLAQVFNSEYDLKKKYGAKGSRTFMIRMSVLRNARTLEIVPKTPPDRCHQLKGRRKGQFAVDLDETRRLVFKPNHEQTPLSDDGSIDLNGVTAIMILDVTDYH